MSATAGAPYSTALGTKPHIDRKRRKVHFHKVTSADGTVIEAWRNVAEGPTVLLCNGLGTSPYAWPGLLDPDCGLRVISWNHRGIGRSARPEDTDRVEVDTFVQDAIAVLDDAGVDRCVVAGWSLGVNTAFELALRHPERVSAIFAVAGVPGRSFASMGAPLLIPRVLREPIGVNVARVMKHAGPALTPVVRRIPIGPISTTALRHSGLMLPTARSKDVKRTVREFLTTPVDWYGHLALAAARHRQVAWARIDVPTMFVAGRWDVLASHRDLRSAADLIDDATYVELFGTHFLNLEQPRTLTRLLHELVHRAAPPPAPRTVNS